MEKTYKICQSCGMPLKQDQQGGGLELDGSKSKMYCSFCYDKGDFTCPNIDSQGMRKMVIDIMKDKIKIPKFIGKLLTLNIKNLERWKK